jgi:hypothetical protein
MSRPEFFGLGGILGSVIGSGYWNRLEAGNRGPNQL